MLWVRNQTTYYVSAYRAVPVIESGGIEDLQRRFFPCEFDCCTINLEWNTYDNADICSGPYRLFVVVVPKTEEIQNVKIRSLKILSSTDHSYELTSQESPVIAIACTGSKDRFSAKMDQSFAFDFNAGEEISTTLEIEFDLGTTIRTEQITVHWRPVSIRYWSSIV